MKYITTLILLCICLSAFSQEVLSETQTIELQRDTTAEDTLAYYYLKSVVTLDNGTEFPDTTITRQLLGDSTTATNYVFSRAVENQQYLAVRMSQAFLARQYRGEFNDYDALYDSIAVETLYERLEDEYYPLYNSRYRITDLEGDSTFFCIVVRVGAQERIRLEHEETGQRWAMLLRSRNNFQLNNFFGSTREFYWDRIPRSNGNRVYKSAAFVEGNHRFIITKLDQ